MGLGCLVSTVEPDTGLEPFCLLVQGPVFCKVKAYCIVACCWNHGNFALFWVQALIFLVVGQPHQPKELKMASRKSYRWIVLWARFNVIWLMPVVSKLCYLCLQMRETFWLILIFQSSETIVYIVNNLSYSFTFKVSV